MTKLVYFAWVREKIGKSEEELEIPDSVKTVRDLVFYLKTLGEEYDEALQNPEAIRVAINQEHAERHELIAGAREIGLFPPMTGG